MAKASRSAILDTMVNDLVRIGMSESDARAYLKDVMLASEAETRNTAPSDIHTALETIRMGCNLVMDAALPEGATVRDGFRIGAEVKEIIEHGTTITSWLLAIHKGRK